MKEEFKYVWVNIPKGTFSDTWDEQTQEWAGKNPNAMKAAIEAGARLIKYTCITDPEFEFTHHLKLK